MKVQRTSGCVFGRLFPPVSKFEVVFSYSDLQLCTSSPPSRGSFEDSANRCTATAGARLQTHLACCQIGELHLIPAVTEHQRGQRPTAPVQSSTGRAHGDHMQTDMTPTLTSVPDESALFEPGACS